jgi:hypothetical protein
MRAEGECSVESLSVTDIQQLLHGAGFAGEWTITRASEVRPAGPSLRFRESGCSSSSWTMPTPAVLASPNSGSRHRSSPGEPTGDTPFILAHCATCLLVGFLLPGIARLTGLIVLAPAVLWIVLHVATYDGSQGASF